MAHGEGKQTNAATQGFDNERLDDLARRYGNVLRRYFERRNAPADVCDDLVQDVYTRLAAREGAGEVEDGEAYLMQTAVSVWSDYWRKIKRRGEDNNVEFDDIVHSPEGLSPERVIEGKEAVKQFLEALDQLPPKTQQIYLLCRMDGVKRKDAAKMFGLTISSIDKHLLAATRHMGLTFGERE